MKLIRIQLSYAILYGFCMVLNCSLNKYFTRIICMKKVYQWMSIWKVVDIEYCCRNRAIHELVVVFCAKIFELVLTREADRLWFFRSTSSKEFVWWKARFWHWLERQISSSCIFKRFNLFQFLRGEFIYEACFFIKILWNLFAYNCHMPYYMDSAWC